MFSGRLWLGFVVVALIWLADPDTASAVKQCYDCHKTTREEFGSKRFIHQPVKEEKCESCHKRHGFANNLVLTDYSSQLCYSCHTDLKEKFAVGSVHFPVGQGKCWDCHDPHASDKPAILRRGPEGADDPNACLMCHKDDLMSSLAAKHQHEPFAKLQCITCHDAHNSAVAGLLKSEDATLCATCHNVKDKKVLAAHEGKQTKGLGCTECHSGHSSESEGLLSETTHAPFAAGDCSSCHSVSDASGKVTFAEGVAPGKLCADCHAEQAAGNSLPFPHAAVEADKCLDCHTAHSSRFGNLLKNSEDNLCGECHSDLIRGEGKVPHHPALAGDCGKCHDVHGSRNKSLVKTTESSLCLQCHIDFASARDSASTIHAGAEDCLQCHSPHEGQSKAVLRSRPNELCRDCHEPESEALAEKSGHQPYLTGDCSGCHQPHFSNTPHLTRTGGIDLCLSCHSKIAQRVGMPVAHPPAQDDCLTCHQPHYSEQDNLLTESEGGLCGGCHESQAIKTDRAYVHTPVSQGDCSGCHNPHGAVQPSLVAGRAVMLNVSGVPILKTPALSEKTADLCYTCHDDLQEKFRTGITHTPVASGDCQVCHEVHGSDHYGLIKDKPSALCGSCHAIDETLSAKHNDYNLADANCTDCHNPHVSPSMGLLRANTHPPFADQMCDDCHTKDAEGKIQLTSEVGALCAGCHDASEKAASMKVKHVPFERGQCSSCHSAHASDSEKLLKYVGNDLCFSCHLDIRVLQKEVVQHQPFEKGNCLDCHLPHASNNGKLTVKPKEDFCLSCHQDLQKELTKGVVHSPARGGNCTACHLPHAGKMPLLLTSSKSELCSKCHNLTSAPMTATHYGFDLSNVDCQNCHAAHSTKQGVKALLLPDAHPPFAARDCNQCHRPGSQRETIFATKELCLNCHESFAPKLAKTVVHPPINEPDGCTGCHGPHVGFGKALQVKDGVKTCLTCHNNQEFTGGIKHAAAFEDCTTCHDPHSNDYKGLLSSPDIMTLCTTCHEDATKTHFHPMGKEVVDPRGKGPLTCVSCHSPHSSDFASILVADKNRKLCVVCHDVGHQ